MSDYISKSALLEQLLEARNDEIIKAVIGLVQTQPTIDEKEIIRKAFERVLQRLEDKKWGIHDWRDKWRNEIIGECIEVVKEEGDIE